MSRRARNTHYFYYLGIAGLILVAILLLITPPGSVLYAVVRGAALLGYVAVFLASMSSLYLRELVKFFGRSFVQVHHRLSVTGLLLITLHPLSVAASFGTLNVIWPRFGSLRAFLEWGGPPAWDLLIIASAAALWRTAIKKSWRTLHYLNYLAFLLGTIHALLIGTDTQFWPVRIVAILMALAVVYAFVRKRLQPARGGRS
jgi:sulfoxide reductase heme-binding subunit YedZ